LQLAATGCGPAVTYDQVFVSDLGEAGVNRYGATMVAASMLLTLAACGGNDAATPVASQPSVIPTTPTPTPKPTPKPVDPTTAAKQKILADYAASFAYIQKGIRYGGAGYAYETWMVDPALTAMKNYMGAVKGVRGAKVTGDGKLLESKITTFDLKAKTATVTACVTDNYTAVAKNGVVVARPPGKIARVDSLKLLKGRWLVSVTDARKPEYGCTR
uniref:hypothetical protein n=1 Tax=Kribbella catacumbae TaxID=460086 RepID=UPI001ED9B75A